MDFSNLDNRERDIIQNYYGFVNFDFMEKYPDLIFNLYQKIGNDYEYDYEFVDQFKYQDLKKNDFNIVVNNNNIKIDYLKFLESTGHKLQIDKNQPCVRKLEHLAKQYRFEQLKNDPYYAILNMDDY